MDHTCRNSAVSPTTFIKYTDTPHLLLGGDKKRADISTSVSWQ